MPSVHHLHRIRVFGLRLLELFSQPVDFRLEQSDLVLQVLDPFPQGFSFFAQHLGALALCSLSLLGSGLIEPFLDLFCLIQLLGTERLLHLNLGRKVGQSHLIV